MTVKRYVKRPTIINAVQWTGENLDECFRFLSCAAALENGSILIRTDEGIVHVEIGDYIVEHPLGVFCNYSPRIFEAKYHELD